MTERVKAILAELATLTESEQEEFGQRFMELKEVQWSAWEQQIADDIAAGRLDQMIAAARREHEAGRTLPLPT